MLYECTCVVHEELGMGCRHAALAGQRLLFALPSNLALPQAASNLPLQGGPTYSPVLASMAWAPNSSAINRILYCGYKQVLLMG